MRLRFFVIGKNSCVEACYQGSNLRFVLLHKNTPLPGQPVRAQHPDCREASQKLLESALARCMSVLGQERSWPLQRATSEIPPEADIGWLLLRSAYAKPGDL
jgi:hypothetical protein